MRKYCFSLLGLLLIPGCGGGSSNTVEAPTIVIEAGTEMPGAGSDVPPPPPLELPPE